MMIPVITLAAETTKPGTKDSASVFKALKDAFDLPEEAKKKNVYDSPFYGYRAGPLIEMLGVFDATHDVEPIQSFTNLMWPSRNQSFCEIMYHFAKKFSELDRIVTRMIHESYGLDKYFDRDCGIESFAHLLRMINYRVP
ncbi:OLC1v1024643C1 [Oldenlandia corymbosa var. corymbosa]|uniref:OLC1v1024643C1 n=1 Tax=Oldenlandia corymbosa var. corymbosa TaxID=529605 RepID=A0AAV1C5X4_OLDCO|nr:OLC1v1024643C1 [Oldenlandia corymbosa var. corymbosa]